MKFKYFKFHNTGIVKRLIIYMVLFSSVITLIITAFQLHWDYHRAIDLIDENLEQINNVHLTALTENVWTSDLDAIKIHLKGISHLQDIIYLEVTDDHNISLSLGQKNSSHFIERQYPMLYTHRAEQHQIGTLTIVTNLNSVYQRLIDKFGFLLLSNAIKTFLVSIFMILIFYQLTTRHLLRIIKYLQSVNNINYDGLLTLNRKTKALNLKDELDFIVDEINNILLDNKNAFNALLESEDRFRILARDSPVGIFRCNIDGNYTYVNERWCKIAGLKYQDALGSKWTSAIHPNDIDRVMLKWSNMIGHNIDFTIECQFQTPNGKVTSLIVQSSPLINCNKQLTGYVGTITDISDRIQMETVLRSVATSGSNQEFKPFLISVLQKLIDVYQCKYAFIAKISEDKLSLHTIINIEHNVIIENTTYDLEESIYSDILTQETNLVENNVSTIYPNCQNSKQMGIESYFGCPIHTVDGATIALLIVMDTRPMQLKAWQKTVFNVFSSRIELEFERKRTTDALQQQQGLLEDLVATRTNELLGALDRAKQANTSKSEFLSRMSHELRTPMNAILGFAQILKLDSDSLNDDQQDNVSEILTAGDHLLNLINEVLDLAKIESGKFQIIMEDVVLDDVVQHCINLITHQANQKNITLIENTSSNDDIIRADFTRLKQVFINLLSNAVKYNCDAGQIKIYSEQINHKQVRISVTDTGEGLNEKNIAKLFTSFERLDALNNVEGTGIGLVITKHLVELMGGRIGVESILHHGSTFWVEFTLANDNIQRQSNEQFN